MRSSAQVLSESSHEEEVLSESSHEEEVLNESSHEETEEEVYESSHEEKEEVLNESSHEVSLREEGGSTWEYREYSRARSYPKYYSFSQGDLQMYQCRAQQSLCLVISFVVDDVS
jgi:hypothetical protein